MSLYHGPLHLQFSFKLTSNVKELHWQFFQFNSSLLSLMSTNFSHADYTQVKSLRFSYVSYLPIYREHLFSIDLTVSFTNHSMVFIFFSCFRDHLSSEVLGNES